MGFSALTTDLYELTMMQGYYLQRQNPEVVFEMFFRRQPFQGGFSVFAGLGTLLETLRGLRFSKEDLEYLRTQGIFREEFLRYLREWRFTGDVWAMQEGSLVFPNEPLLRVRTNLIEAQLIESLLLNIINFQTLIATKAARIYSASGGGRILEFGLRRAQGRDGALSAARAAYIGGVSATSNTEAGKIYGIPVTGTMAHSWIMSFDTEMEAFEKYTEIYPDRAFFLIDTYDTLGSGIKNAIKIGRRLKDEGKSIGVRLDSGDLQYLSEQVRMELDNAGLEDATIAVSNELSEEIIWQLVANGAPIDIWGVGTNLVTGGSDSSLTGVYKLAARHSGGALQPTIKVSNNPEKTTNPGIKQVYRFYSPEEVPLGDLLTLDDEILDESKEHRFYHPIYRNGSFLMKNHRTCRPLLTPAIRQGERAAEPESLEAIRSRVVQNLSNLHRTHKRIINPHIYKVSLSEKLRELKFRMVDERVS